jgi:hypothetical protein
LAAVDRVATELLDDSCSLARSMWPLQREL